MPGRVLLPRVGNGLTRRSPPCPGRDNPQPRKHSFRGTAPHPAPSLQAFALPLPASVLTRARIPCRDFSSPAPSLQGLPSLSRVPSDPRPGIPYPVSTLPAGVLQFLTRISTPPAAVAQFLARTSSLPGSLPAGSPTSLPRSFPCPSFPIPLQGPSPPEFCSYPGLQLLTRTPMLLSGVVQFLARPLPGSGFPTPGL